MGPIQSSLNQLTLSTLGAIAGVAKGFRGGFNQPKQKSNEQEKKSPINYGPTLMDGGNFEYTAKLGPRAYNKYRGALAAQQSGNDMIEQKARATFRSADQRLAEIRNQQTESITQNAIGEFGLTEDVSKGIYMLPDGRMIDGTYGGSTPFRSVEHNDIGSAYESAGVESKGGIDSMFDFMKRGNIRMLPETETIDISSKPTSQQMNAIYKMFKDGKLKDISISDDDKTLEYIQNVESEEQIANLIKKHFSKGGK